MIIKSISEMAAKAILKKRNIEKQILYRKNMIILITIEYFLLPKGNNVPNGQHIRERDNINDRT